MLNGNCFGDEMLSCYIDGRLSEREARRIRAHLEVCSVCRKRLQLLSTPKRVLTRLPERCSTLSFNSVVDAYRRRSRLMKLVRRAVVWGSVAAAVLIAVVLLLPETTSPLPYREPTPHRGVVVKIPAQGPASSEPRVPHRRPEPKVVKRQPKQPNDTPPSAKHPEAPHEQVVKVESLLREQRRVSVRSTPVVEQTPLLFEDVIAQFNRARQELSLIHI